MNSLKTLLVIALLAVGMGGVYLGLHNRGFDGQPPKEVSGLDWALDPPLDSPDVQLALDPDTMSYSTDSGLSGGDSGDFAPRFSPTEPRDASAPPLYGGSYPPASDPQWPAEEEPGGSVAQGELYIPSSRFDSPSSDPPTPAFQDPRNDPLAVNPLDSARGPSSGGPTTLCPEFLDLMQGARAELARGRFAEIHDQLSRRYDNPRLTPEERRHITDLLDQVAWTVIYSSEYYLEKPYRVMPGDTLDTIGNQYAVSGTLLGRINGIRPLEELVPGREIKAVRGPFNAVIHLDSFELTLKLQEKYYAGRFRIGIGGDSSQLEGSYRVVEKRINPDYYDPSGNVIDGGDPANPLGKYLIRLDDRVGLHGTDDPRNVGSTTGQGSLCLDDRDIEDLFGILTTKSRVVIRR